MHIAKRVTGSRNTIFRRRLSGHVHLSLVCRPIGLWKHWSADRMARSVCFLERDLRCINPVPDIIIISRHLQGFSPPTFAVAAAQVRPVL